MVFLRFGESSLDFQLRIYIPHREHWAPVTHAVHQGIDDAFREASIEIAFPQRDLHIRSAPGLRDVSGLNSTGTPGVEPEEKEGT